MCAFYATFPREMGPLVLSFIDNLNSAIFVGQLFSNVKCVIGTCINDNDCFPSFKGLLLKRLNALLKIATIVVGRDDD